MLLCCSVAVEGRQCSFPSLSKFVVFFFLILAGVKEHRRAGNHRGRQGGAWYRCSSRKERLEVLMWVNTLINDD